jgi:hypothetical protein
LDGTNLCHQRPSFEYALSAEVSTTAGMGGGGVVVRSYAANIDGTSQGPP